MTQHPTNKRSLELAKNFANDLDMQLASLVKSILDSDEPPEFKLDVIRKRVVDNRNKLRKFENSLEWEDEE